MNEEITLLFAVEAEQLLLSGFVEEAIDLLKKGIEKFPDYSAANAILAKAYTLLGNDDDANKTITNLKETNYFYNKIGFNSESATILNPDPIAPPINFNENLESNPTFQSFNVLPVNKNDISNETEEQVEELIINFSDININNIKITKEENLEDEKILAVENIEIDDLLKSFDKEENLEDEKILAVENIEIDNLLESIDTSDNIEDEKIITANLEIEDLINSIDLEIRHKEEDGNADLNSFVDEIKDSSGFEEENFTEIIDSNQTVEILGSYTENEVIGNKDIEQNFGTIRTLELTKESSNITESVNFFETFETNDDSEINLEFEDTSEKLFSSESEEFDIDEFIKKNSIKKEIKEFQIPFIDVELKKIPTLFHPFKNFVYKPIKISYTEHLKYIDKIFNLEDDRKIIGLHFIGKNISSELFADEILHTNEKSEEKTKVNENYSFASETIARIYRQQGAFKEAIAAYKELMISDPSKKEYYQGEINQMMES